MGPAVPSLASHALDVDDDDCLTEKIRLRQNRPFAANVFEPFAHFNQSLVFTHALIGLCKS